MSTEYEINRARDNAISGGIHLYQEALKRVDKELGPFDTLTLEGHERMERRAGIVAIIAALILCDSWSAEHLRGIEDGINRLRP